MMEDHSEYRHGRTFSMYIVKLVLLVFFLFSLNAYGVRPVTDPIMGELWSQRKELRGLWDFLQIAFHCCGSDSIIGWIPHTPRSCCAWTAENEECIALVNAHATNCCTAVGDFLLFAINISGIITFFGILYRFLKFCS